MLVSGIRATQFHLAFFRYVLSLTKVFFQLQLRHVPDIKLIESVPIPEIIYGCETWTNMNKKILKILENIQKDAITLTNSIPKSTPYQGLL